MGGTLDDGSIRGRANAVTNCSPARCMTGGMRRGTSESTAAYNHRMNNAPEANFAMRTKSTWGRPHKEGEGPGHLSRRGAKVMAGPARATTGAAGATTGAAGVTTGAANAPTGAYARRVRLTGPIATHACHCVLRCR